MTEKYHSFVFDMENRSFVGDFEKMYSLEISNNFDSWHERDLRMLRKQISLSVIDQYNSKNILELGCGKGTLTQYFKKKNNHVTAIDISETAIKRAENSYPDINFICTPIYEYVSTIESKFDLTIIMGTLAYIEKWEEVIQKLSKNTEYLYIAEFIPINPIGFVKSMSDLMDCFQTYFDIESKIVLDDQQILLMGKSKKC